MAHSVDSDFFWNSSLILAYSVCPDLSIQKLRIIDRICHSFNLFFRLQSIPMVHPPSVRRSQFRTWISLREVGQSWSNFMCSITGVGKSCISIWDRSKQNSGFHGNRKCQGEFILYQWSFKLEYLSGKLANLDQILCAASLRWGKTA